MSYFDRLPLYVTPGETSSCGWYFPTFVRDIYTEDKNLNSSNQTNTQTQQVQVQEQQSEKQDEHELSYNELSYNEWVDEMLEKMYLNEDGHHDCEKERTHNDNKSHNNNNIDNHTRESEELMFQFDLDWDIEKGRL